MGKQRPIGELRFLGAGGREVCGGIFALAALAHVAEGQPSEGW